MKITKIRLAIIKVPLRVPFKTALRSVNGVEDVVVEIHTDCGRIGYGEAPPTAAVTGETSGSIIGAFNDHITKTLVGRNVDELEDILVALNSCILKNTSAKAAADMALWDLYGQLYNIPVYKLLGGSRKKLVTDITISVNSPEEMATDAINAQQRGYDCLKIKVGNDPELDLERMLAIRGAVGSKMLLRIDANQGWSAREAVRILNSLAEKGLEIELVEQPVRAHDLEGLKYVTKHSHVPVLADESLFSPEDAMRILYERAADLINIKLMKCGGIYNALKIAAMAEVCNVECMMGCMLESRLSVNAAIHFACAKRIITKIDLDTPVLCTGDPVEGGSVYDEKHITVSEQPGLGISGIKGLEYIN